MASLVDLVSDLGSVVLLEAADGAELWARRLARCHRLLNLRVIPASQGERCGLPLVLIIGGTNVGKSTLLNALSREVLSRASPLARGTKQPVVAAHESDRQALDQSPPVPGWPLQPSAGPDAPLQPLDAPGALLATHHHDALRGVVLLDSPDIDSDYQLNHVTAADLLLVADMVLFVTTPEKYNDQLCLDTLREAVKLRKHVLVVLNKTTGADAARVRDDLHDVCEATATGSNSPLEIVEVPLVPDSVDPRLLTDALRPVESTITDTDIHHRARASADRGARAALAQELGTVVDRAELEAAELMRLQSAMEKARDTAVARYRRRLDGLNFHELDAVYRRVLDELRLPVVDDLYALMGTLGRAGTSGLQRLLGNGTSPATDTPAEARRHREVEWSKDAIQHAESAIADIPRQIGAGLTEAARSWLPGPLTVEARGHALDRHLAAVDAAAETWVREETARQVELLQRHPARRELLRAVRGALRLGPALLAVKLTGGLGPTDVLTGPATDFAVRQLLDGMGDRLYFQRRRAEHLDARADLLGRCIESLLVSPVAASVPAAVDTGLLQRLRETARQLSSESSAAESGT